MTTSDRIIQPTKPPAQTTLAENIGQALTRSQDPTVNEAAIKVALDLVAAAQAAHDFEAVQSTDDIPAEKQFMSVGSACGLLQLSPSDLRLAMRKAGAKFAYTQNDVPYIAGDELVKVSRLLGEIRKRASDRN